MYIAHRQISEKEKCNADVELLVGGSLCFLSHLTRHRCQLSTLTNTAKMQRESEKNSIFDIPHWREKTRILLHP